jgi:hypothetical protein
LEKWKDIRKYEGLYKISNKGNVKSFHKQEKKLKPILSKRNYFTVTLYKNGVGVQKRISRLVGKSFIENDKNKPFINHIDGNKLNNNATNLEWVTAKENMVHASKSGLIPNSISIKLTNKKTNEKMHFFSMSEASRYMGRQFSYIQTNIRETNTYENNEFRWEYST